MPRRNAESLGFEQEKVAEIKLKEFLEKLSADAKPGTLAGGTYLSIHVHGLGDIMDSDISSITVVRGKRSDTTEIKIIALGKVGRS